MSLLSSRISMVHRCTVERNQNIGTDDGWTNPLAPDWQTNLDDVPCRGWTANHSTVTNKGTIAVVIEVHLLVPLGTDTVEGDRVPTITHRDATLFQGPWSVHAVLTRRDYLEVILARAS